MMAKVKKLVFIFIGLLFLTGCNSTSNQGIKEGKSTEESVNNIFANMSSLGEGTFNISSEQGNSKEGMEVVIRYDNNKEKAPIKIETEGIDSNMTSYIYSDGQLLDQLQLSNSKETIDLKKVSNAVTESIHELVLVQYSDERMKNGISTLKKQKYTVVNTASE